MKICPISKTSFKQIIACNRKSNTDETKPEDPKLATSLFTSMRYDSFFVHEDCLYHDVFVREIQREQEQK